MSGPNIRNLNSLAKRFWGVITKVSSLIIASYEQAMCLTLVHMVSKVYNEVNYVTQQLAIRIIKLLLKFNEVCKLALS